MRPIKAELLPSLLITLAALLIAACGSDQEQHGESKPKPPAVASPGATAYKPEKDMLREMRRALTANGFINVAEKLEDYVRPTVIATTARAREKDFQLGQSKIGGLAHLPPDFVWPVFKGAPLHFVAQINLSELPPGPVAAELPAEGLLYFFYADGLHVWGHNLEDRGAAVVQHYLGDLSRLQPTEKPAGRNDIRRGGSGEVYRYKPSSLSFTMAYELPTSQELLDLDELLTGLEPSQRDQAEAIIDEVMYGPDEYEENESKNENEARPAFGPSVELQQQMSNRAAKLMRDSGLLGENPGQLSPEDSMEAYMKITELINSDPEMRRLSAEAFSQTDLTPMPPLKGDDPWDDAKYSGLHKIMGWPQLVQGSVFFEAEHTISGLDFSEYEQVNQENIKAVEAGAKDWRLLLQVDTDGNSEIMWGDLGTLYFLIRKDDLAAGRFENIWFSWQCH